MTEKVENITKDFEAPVPDEKTIQSEESNVVLSTANDEDVKDEFLYLKREEFTSEIYKIEVRNLGYFGIGEFKKLLRSKLNLNVAKVKRPHGKSFAYVCFRTEEDQRRALEALNGYKWKGKELSAETAKACADPLMKRRNEENNADNDNAPAKKRRTTADATCPLSLLPYEQQLQQKSAEMSEILKKMMKALKKNNSKYKNQISKFKFEGVKPSPQINGYRNKNEFTVGKNASGEVVVGFRLGSYADGSTEVAEVADLPHISCASKWAAKSFQDFMKSSNFQAFNPEQNSGHIKQLMVRTSQKTGEIMIVVGVYSSNLKKDEVVDLKESLKAYYAECKSVEKDGHSYKCTSLYYQDVKRREAGQMTNPVELISGLSHITDTICDLDFRISPLAFFQINTLGANVLYQTAIDLISPQPYTTVLDICCGTGTIGLAFSKHCRNVMGVDIIPDAIKDAEFNAEANGIKNCKFFTGNADDYIQTMTRQVIYNNPPSKPLDLVAVVDPPRAGVHTRSIAALRAATSIKRLVYISCNPALALRNWTELGRPESKQYKGDPFFPTKAVAVDMFPHTSHTELVILFERVNDAQYSKLEQKPGSGITNAEVVQNKAKGVPSDVETKNDNKKNVEPSAGTKKKNEVDQDENASNSTKTSKDNILETTQTA